MTDPISHERSSGNVFSDIGPPAEDEHLIKAKLDFKIGAPMRERGLKRAEAAKLFSVKQPDVSKMPRGDFRQFSVERPMRFLEALRQDVRIVVKPHRDATVAPAPQVARTEASPTGPATRKANSRRIVRLTPRT